MANSLVTSNIARTSAGKGRNLHMETLKLLLVDDNPDDRALAIHELRKEFPCLVVDQIYQADDLARAQEGLYFDLVITEFKLHWSDGLEVLRRVKSVLPGCPVVMFCLLYTSDAADE